MAGFGLTPFFRPWYDDVTRSHSLFDQFFGQPLFDEDLVSPFDYWPELYPSSGRRPGGALGYYWPRQQQQQLGQGQGRLTSGVGGGEAGQAGPLRPSFDRARSGRSQVVNDRNEFRVCLDVQQFKPEEVTVKTDDKYVTIEGRHEEQPDEHGYVKRHFVRRYLIPEGVKPEDVKGQLSADGVLTVAAPKQQPALPEGQERERKVPIARSPHPAIARGTQGQGEPQGQGQGQGQPQGQGQGQGQQKQQGQQMEQ